MILFISYLAGHYSSTTIRNSTAAVRAWHTIHLIPWIIDQTILNDAIQAAKRLMPPTSLRNPRDPITTVHIAKVKSAIDPSLPCDIAVFACLTTIFWSCSRVGEFTIPTQASFDRNTHIKPSDVTIQTDPFGNEVYAFRLLKTKTSTVGEEVYWGKQTGPSDPLTAILAHIRVNRPPPNGPLFSYRKGKGHTPLTKSFFLSRLKQLARIAQLPHLTGHCIRIGSTLEYLLRGTPFDVVKLIGRWSSNSFTLYLCKHAQILARFMQKTPKVRDALIRYEMPPPRHPTTNS